MQLFNIKSNPSKKFDLLSRLRTQREIKVQELQRLDTEIASIEAELNQLLGNAPSSNQTLGTTQVTPAVPNRTQQPIQQPMAPQATQSRPVPSTNAVRTQPASASVTNTPVSNQGPSRNGQVQSRLAPTAVNAVPVAAQSNSAIPNIAASIINDRAPYHTQDLQIVGVQPNAQIIMHKHYLAGDGVSSGIQALEGCAVTYQVSKAGKPYRQMETPALKITCTLTQALPEDIASRRRVIKEWMTANNWMTSQDPAKAVFETEYDAYGEIYTPYVSVDSKGATLYIYIGCESMASAKPCPTLIA